MDDPILSLDDDHRESWSANILKPALEYLQVILATHQRQYLNHCKYDFCQCSVVELNPRSRSRRLSWRPGFRLDRAEEELQRAPTNAPNELRKYREELLCTLDAYSPAPFFNSGNLAQSLLDFCRLAAPHPLASRTQTRIVELLNDPEVARVLDPGSHHLTEADVTAAMSHQCLAKLRQCDTKLRDELDRLERLRAHERRGRALPAVAEGPLGVSDAAYWADPICIKALGRAAAKQDSWECDESEDATRLTLPPGAAVLAMADTLDPVVRPGQWLLIAAEDSAVLDGDLVVARVDGRRLLRRAWTDGANWHLASFNPVRPSKPVIAPRASATMRRIWGVLYEPIGLGGAGSYADGDEWQPRTDFDPAWVTTLHAITVEGSSLEPLARRGQKVLVASKQAPTETVIEQGGLAVLETSDESVGNVIKRVFRRKDRWVLVSPNPVEPQEPLVLLPAAVAAVWPMRGVLFESSVDGDAES
jgi:SOS-response transcriptional repressor LexA